MIKNNKTIIIILGIIALVFTTTFFFSTTLYPIKYYDEILDSSKKYGVAPSLVLAIIKCESGFNQTVVSKAGAVGLMQIMPSTAKYIANKINYNNETINLFEVKTNIELGVAYLKYLLDKFNKTDVAICAYNAGERNVLNWLDNNSELIKIEFNETKIYLNKVLKANDIYKKKLNQYNKL